MSSFRQLMMRKKGGGVEFKTSIYATGNAYIQTDISSNGDYKVKIVAKYLKYYSSPLVPVSAEIVSNGKWTGTFLFLSYNGGTSTNGLSLRSVNNDYYYNPTYQDTRNTVYANNTYTLQINNTIPVNTTYVIFNDRGGYTNDYVAINLIEIKDQSDNLIAELKPATVNGEDGMYDTVGQQFYGNANSVGSLVCE